MTFPSILSIIVVSIVNIFYIVAKNSPNQAFEQRKKEHIQHALDANNQALNQAFSHFSLIHEALPELNFDEISLTSKRFGQLITTPFMISSMTAGHPDSININARLAMACQESHWAMGVGSQRKELFDNDAKSEWKKIKNQAPNVHFFGNIGLSQLITTPEKALLTLVENLEAKAMQVHLNPLQECIQEEGTPQFKGGLKAISQLVKRLDIPVVVKETGCGLSQKTCERLWSVGVSAIDVSGLGGTHWGRIEGARAQEKPSQQAAKTFKNWGIHTLDAIKNATVSTIAGEVWGSGGIRDGQDAAKCLALGASSVGVAKPMLESALIGVDETIKQMKQFEHELKIALFCTGSKNIETLQEIHRD